MYNLLHVHSNDIVDVSNCHGNNTLAVKTTKPGHVMLKVELTLTEVSCIIECDDLGVVVGATFDLRLHTHNSGICHNAIASYCTC